MYGFFYDMKCRLQHEKKISKGVLIVLYMMPIRPVLLYDLITKIGHNFREKVSPNLKLAKHLTFQAHSFY